MSQKTLLTPQLTSFETSTFIKISLQYSHTYWGVAIGNSLNTLLFESNKVTYNTEISDRPHTVTDSEQVTF